MILTKLSKGNREIELGDSYRVYPRNQIRTSKYTPLTFVPLNLFQQFSKASNIFFLILAILQTIRSISITGGLPTIAPVLLLILVISAVKDFFEDYKRWKSDDSENKAVCEIFLFKKAKKIQKNTQLVSGKTGLTKDASLHVKSESSRRSVKLTKTEKIRKKRRKTVLVRTKKKSKSKSKKPVAASQDDLTPLTRMRKSVSAGCEVEHIRWEQLLVGDVIKIDKNRPIPADVLVLACSNLQGRVFVETKNLDGETNLKTKTVPETLSTFKKDFCKIALKEEQLKTLDEVPVPSLPKLIPGDIDKYLNKLKKHDLQVFYEPPNEHLYTFQGSLQMIVNRDLGLEGPKVPLEEKNVLLRGSFLRNTDFVFGLVLYTGHDTKIMKNSVAAKVKWSKLEQQLNLYLQLMFFFLILFCTVGSTFNILWIKRNTDRVPYMDIPSRLTITFFTRLGNWLLIFANIIPISLMVSLESVKFMQAKIIAKDPKMESAETKIKCEVQSSNLNEELGQIDFIFSDKTGTLTCNLMNFKKLVVGNRAYGEPQENTEDSSFELFLRKYSLTQVSNVDFVDAEFMKDLHKPATVDYLRGLALCHDILVDSGEYNASSPDELALVNFAKMCGIEYKETTANNLIRLSEFGEEKTFVLLETLEFNSNRKRMSVIVEDSQERLILICKGADNKILERSCNVQECAELIEKVNGFAVEGLRTLLVAQKEMTREEYLEFSEDYREAKATLGEDRAKLVAEVQEQIERGLRIVGATAIEDKLQDQIAETIDFLKKAGIKVWVLTGDKVETALTIGYSTKLLSSGMDLIYLTDPVSVEDSLSSHQKRLYAGINQKKNGQDLEIQRDDTVHALVISGDCLIAISDNKKSLELLSKIAIKCESVLCCRVSPKQKAEIVKMVRRVLPRARTLSIGDGANDVNMITEAHIGIGIRGVEGQQAARASDYSIGEFKHLKRLMVFYGREAYRKNSLLVLYTFWKNILLVFPQFWLSLISLNFSGMPLYEKYMYQLFNVCYASLPIVIFAVLDTELEEINFLTNPQLYRGGLKKIYFNFWIFILWVTRGLLHSFFIALFSSYLSSQVNRNGHSFNFSELGIVIYFYLCFFVNTNIYVISNSFSILSNFVVILSIASLVVSVFIISLFKKKIEYGLFLVIFKNPFFFVILVCLFVIITLFDVLFDTLQRIIFFNFVGVIVSEDQDSDEETVALLDEDQKQNVIETKIQNVATEKATKPSFQLKTTENSFDLNLSNEDSEIFPIKKPNNLNFQPKIN